MIKKLYGCLDLIILIFIAIIVFNVINRSGDVSIFEKPINSRLWQEATLTSKPVFVYFYGDYCGACRKIKPLIYQVSDEFSSEYTFLPVDVSNPDNRCLANAFRVRGIPSIFLVDHIYERHLKLKLRYDVDYFRQEMQSFIQN